MKEPHIIAFNPKSKDKGCNIISMMSENTDYIKKRVLNVKTINVFVMPIGQFIIGAKSYIYY
jgi:hypothetical protein